MDKNEEILQKFRKEKPWGLHTIVDLKDCNPDIIRDGKKIKEFVDKLCKLIEMRQYGETQIVDFGEDPRVSGYSMVQLIETSCIAGHFANQTNAAYLDIFSCKEYPPHVAADFCKEFFGAKEANVTINFRY